MTTSPDVSRSAAVRPRRWVLLVAILAGGAALGVFGWRWYTAPQPPVIDLSGADPAIARAVDAALAKVREQPRSLEAWAHLGQLLRASNYLEAAVLCFAQAERLDPRNPRWPHLQGEGLLLRGDSDAALPHLQRAAARYEGEYQNELAPRLLLAEVLLAGGRYDEAEEQLRRAHEVDESHPAIPLGLGLAAYARDDFGSSQKYLERAQHGVATRQRACARLAALYARQGDAAKAAQYERRARTLPPDPGWIDPYVMECLRRAVGKPSRFRYVEGLEAQGRAGEAAQMLREMLAEGPDYRVYVGLGKNLIQAGDLDGAEEALREAIKMTPDNVQAYYFLSKLFWARAEQQAYKNETRNLYDRAAAAARKALAQKPDHALAHVLLGLSLRRLGLREEGLASLRTAVQCGPDLPDPHLYLGEALADEGQESEARRHLDLALELARPDDPRPRAALDRLRGKGNGPSQTRPP
jgi:tetratricopeptide (TPR) repeat protein